MVKFELQQIPNQKLAIAIDSHTYELAFRSLNGMTYADANIDGTPVARGVRCVSYGFIIPYRFMEKGGNFVLSSSENSYPYFTDFGITCNLYYLSQEECYAVRKTAIDD